MEKVAKEAIEDVGEDTIKSLLSGTFQGKGKQKKPTEATITTIRALNNGDITTKAQAKDLTEAIKKAQDRLEANDYSRSALERIAQDVGLPLAAGAARTAGLGYYLYQQILPELLAAAARQEEAKVNPVWRQGLTMNTNPLATQAALSKGLANFKGGTVQAGLNSLADITEGVAEGWKADSQAARNRDYLRDLSTVGQSEDWSAAQWDTTRKAFAGGANG